ncbi:hypothetical protein Tdes44962_MAKER09990 [Teratosphaeria destructans]|uniref:Uncharacterized protein n=1 Tax=Teratosphaeria destructans TaxID=418781 RepID=A0A9W7W1K5_9PEZI|nr:hypothetical protein Tdes44962_MAKER09990 [Teratosphaeria destructans]
MAIPIHLLPEQQPETALPHEFDQGLPPARTRREQRRNRWTVFSTPAPPCNLTPRDLWGKRTPYFGNEEFRAADALARRPPPHKPRKRKDRPARNFRDVTEATMQSHIRRADAEEGYRTRTGQVAFTLRDGEGDRTAVTREEDAEYDIQIKDHSMGERTARRVRRGKERKNELKRVREDEADETWDRAPKKTKPAPRQQPSVDISARGLKAALRQQKQDVKATAMAEEKRAREAAVLEKALPTRLKEPTAEVELEVEEEPTEIPPSDIGLEEEPSEIPPSDIELEDVGE